MRPSLSKHDEPHRKDFELLPFLLLHHFHSQSFCGWVNGGTQRKKGADIHARKHLILLLYYIIPAYFLNDRLLFY